ncbi:hypothetical protein BURK2_04399 [Burkholderiales bacterium]|nr:hypothetical protein BURK2_04399 [Burkholderiales bacterium]
MSSGLPRPFVPLPIDPGTLERFDLPALAEALTREDEYGQSGVAALSLARTEAMRLVLVALRRGATMREHKAPSPACVVCISGRARLEADAGARAKDLAPGTLAVFAPDVAHSVTALEDTAYLVAIGGRSAS